MQLVREQLGKVGITVDKDYWSIDRAYDRLVIVEVKGEFRTYISRKPVPAGVLLNDREYWIPFSSLKEELIGNYNAWLNKYSEILDLGLDRIKEYIVDTDYIPVGNKHENEFLNAIGFLLNFTIDSRWLLSKCINCQLNFTYDNTQIVNPVNSILTTVIFNAETHRDTHILTSKYYEIGENGINTVYLYFVIRYGSDHNNLNMVATCEPDEGYYIDSSSVTTNPNHRFYADDNITEHFDNSTNIYTITMNNFSGRALHYLNAKKNG